MATTREQPSGIVLYPMETQGKWDGIPYGSRPIGANIARQLGAVTNATINDGGEVRLGSVHAIGYEPEIAEALTNLYYPRGPKGGITTPGRGSVEAEIKAEYLEKLHALMYEYLDAANLAFGGLAAALAGRRVDMIAPNGLLGSSEALAAAIRPIHPDRTISEDGLSDGILWTKERQRGVFTEQPYARSPRLGRKHPLYKRMRASGAVPSDHTIATSLATLGSRVEQRFKLHESRDSKEIIAHSSGFGLETTGQKVETTFRATYNLPVEPEVDAEIREVELRVMDQNEDDDAERVESGDGYSYEGMYEPHPVGDIIQRKQRSIAGAIDPLDDFEWRLRLC